MLVSPKITSTLIKDQRCNRTVLGTSEPAGKPIRGAPRASGCLCVLGSARKEGSHNSRNLLLVASQYNSQRQPITVSVSNRVVSSNAFSMPMEESIVVAQHLGWPGFFATAARKPVTSFHTVGLSPINIDNGKNRSDHKPASVSINVSIFVDDSQGPLFMSGRLCPTPCTVRSKCARSMSTKSREIFLTNSCSTASGIENRDFPVATLDTSSSRPTCGQSRQCSGKRLHSHPIDLQDECCVVPPPSINPCTIPAAPVSNAPASP